MILQASLDAQKTFLEKPDPEWALDAFFFRWSTSVLQV